MPCPPLLEFRIRRAKLKAPQRRAPYGCASILAGQRNDAFADPIRQASSIGGIETELHGGSDFVDVLAARP